MQHKPCLMSMRKTKYGLVELTRRKLSCPHSKVLAQYYLDTLERVEVTGELEEDSNENTESKNGTYACLHLALLVHAMTHLSLCITVPAPEP